MVKKIIIACSILFVLSFFRIAPVVYKGYAPTGLHENIILARNLAVSGKYSIENQKNVILSSSKIAQEGVVSTFGNKLTIYIYSFIFKILGFSPNLPFYASVLMFAFSAVLIFLIIFEIFGNFWLAATASSLDLFMPFVWKGSLFAGAYEFAVVFFLLGLLLYIKWRSKNPYVLVLSGLFFGLAIASRNAFLFSVLAIAFYEFYRTRKWKWAVFVAAPALAVFLLLGALNNSYVKSTDESFTRYGHLFPDPYTYHFEKDEYIKDVALSSNDPEFVEFLAKYGYSVPLSKTIRVYAWSFIFYIKESFSLINFGGPLFVFLAFFGAVMLYKEKREWFAFCVFWLSLLYLGLILLKTNNWDHFLEIRPIIILFISFAVWKIIGIFKIYFSQKKSVLLSAVFVSLLAFQLFYTNKWLFHQDYEASFMPKANLIIDNLKKRGLSKEDVIAVDHNQNATAILNYYTDLSFVYFSHETLEKLEEKGNLQDVLKKFGVTYLIRDEK